jgi:Flp pilus assembly protein TadD
VTAIRRAQAEALDDLAQTRLLEPAAEIALAAGDIVSARASTDRLTAVADAADAPLLRATALRMDGAVRMAEGDADGALRVLRQAWEEWSGPGALRSASGR